MELGKLFEQWKTILSFAVAIVVATVSVVTWAENSQQQAVQLMEAKQALIHDAMYQQTRIERKELEMKEHQRELEQLLRRIGDDEPTPREEREISYLDNEISRLKKEIEEIRVNLEKINE